MTRQPKKYPPLLHSWHWKIMGKPKIPFSQVLPVGMATRSMVMEMGFTLTGSRHLPTCLHRYQTLDQGGKNPPGQSPDSYWLAEDRDSDGFIDHITLFSYPGLSPAAIILLAHCHRLVLSDGTCCDLVMAGANTALSALSASSKGGSRIWKSTSPWFPSPKMHSRKNWTEQRNIAMMVNRELKRRNMVQPVSIDIMPAEKFVYKREDFPRQRKKGEKIPAASRGHYLKLTFAEAVTAPLNLGFGSHFGLGAFGAV